MTLEQEQALAMASARLRLNQQTIGGASPTKSPLESLGEAAQNVVTAPVEPALHLGSGAVAAPIAGLMGLGSAVTGMGGEPGDVVRKTQEALTYEPKTLFGKRATEGATFLPRMYEKGANWVGGAVTDNPRGGPEAGAAVKTGIMALPALLGLKAPVPKSLALPVPEAVQGAFDLVHSGGPHNILVRGQRRLIGEENIDKVATALENAKELVPGSRPTASQALAGVPEGSPLQTHEAIIAKTAGGPSGKFGQRVADQLAARETALAERDKVTAPMREKALEGTNQPGVLDFKVVEGGVNSKGVLEGISKISNTPGLRASTLVSKTLDAIKNKIEKFTREDGTIDGRDLYTVRQEIGSTIEKYSKETANWDKRLTSGLEASVQKHIDNAIEGAGGVGWKDYLKEFSERSKAVTADELRAKTAKRPVQRTSILGTATEATEAAQHLLPTLLSRPVMATRFITTELAKNIQPKVDALAAQRYLNPQELAATLRRPQPTPNQALIDAILRRSAAPAVVGATTTGASQ
jgi:hypothetical protein